MSKRHGKKIAIIGGGIGGLTAALCMLRRGFDVEVYEQAPELKEIGAGIQIGPNASRVLIKLGLRDSVEAVAFRPQAFQMRRWRDDSAIVYGELGQACEDRFGAPYYTFHRADLLAALANALPAGVVQLGRKLVTVTDKGDGVELVFEDGRTETASLAIAADGLKSTVRQAVVQDKARFARQAVCRGLVPADRLKDVVAEKSVIMWVGPGKHMVSYPVSSGKLFNWGLAIPAAEEQLESWTNEGSTADALAAVEEWNDRVRRIVSSADRTLVLPLYDRDPTHRLAKGRITLLGDAAHPMLPFIAQGAAQAIEDGWAIADCMTEASSDAESQLRHYERLRGARAEEVQMRSRANSELFHMDDGAQQEARDVALKGGEISLAAFDWLYGYDVTSAVEQDLAGSGS